MNTNTGSNSTTDTRLKDLTLETKAAKELREIILVLRAASIPEDKMCAFLDRYVNGRKLYEN